MTLSRYHIGGLCAGALASFALALTAMAQEGGRPGGRSHADDERAINLPMEVGEPRRPQPRTDRLATKPPGWARVAIDYDQDGRWDAFEAIFYDDLRVARHRSRQRSDNAAWPPTSDERRDTRRVRGRIMDRLTVRIGGQDQVLARIETNEGRRAKVWLGPRHRIDELALRDGDQVTVEGVRVLVNEMPLLFARRLSTSGRTVTNDLPPGGDLRVVRGRLESKNVRTFRGRRGRILLPKSKRPTVELGP